MAHTREIEPIASLEMSADPDMTSHVNRRAHVSWYLAEYFAMISISFTLVLLLSSLPRVLPVMPVLIPRSNNYINTYLLVL